MKMNWKIPNNEKTLRVIGYVFCVLTTIIIIILVNIMLYMFEDEHIEIEVSNINSTEIKGEEFIRNHKIEILDYGQLSYFVRVNCQEQIVTVYTADENGEYTIPIKKMLCSTGVATPNTGIYTISDKYEWRYLVGNVYGQYATRITGPILFHSVPYTKKDKSSLEYWEYDKLGQPASKGCVRLTVEDAKWIYDYCRPGTSVEFYEDGDELNNEINKDVSALKISDCDEALRCWDPTDPDENNPWLDNGKNMEK